MNLLSSVPLVQNDAMVFALLMVCLGLVFYTSGSNNTFWKKFYGWVPALLMCYFLPAILASTGVISAEAYSLEVDGEMVEKKSKVYYIASRYLLPASLVLFTLSIDLKAIFDLGSRAIIMFFAATAGIVLGGPIAVFIVGLLSPETIAGTGFDAAWRGLATLAGSWIGGGANQAAMLEIFQYNEKKYGAMVLVDIAVANAWMAILIVGIAKRERINKWLKADDTAIENLKKKVSSFQETIRREPTLKDYMLMLAIAFGAVGIAHVCGDYISNYLLNFEIFKDKSSFVSSLAGAFFWLVSISTLIGIICSFTPLKYLEGAGASKIGSVFIYILVATIGMKMDLLSVLKDPWLLAIGFIWMAIHALTLIVTAKLTRSPYFFLAVGSQANVGGAASAPVVAAEFHPSLASVGVLLAVFGYVVGTVGALLCAKLMELATLWVI